MQVWRAVGLLGLVLVLVAGLSFSPVGFFALEGQSVGVKVTEHGVVQEMFRDCPPSRQQNQTCTGFDIFLLRTPEGKTYLLKDLPNARQWRNLPAIITGYLIAPTNSTLSFVDGDLYVLSIQNA